MSKRRWAVWVDWTDWALRVGGVYIDRDPLRLHHIRDPYWDRYVFSLPGEMVLTRNGYNK